MSTTPVRTTVLAATLLAGTLTLGAGAQVDEPPVGGAAGAGVEPPRDEAGLPFTPTPAVPAEELRAIRLLHPTAGLEVPPADLRARARVTVTETAPLPRTADRLERQRTVARQGPTAGLEVPPTDLRARTAEPAAATEAAAPEQEDGTAERSGRPRVPGSTDRITRQAQ